MIDLTEIKKIIDNNLYKNVICRNFDMKPRNLAYYIAQLSNLDYEYGYYINGVERLSGKYIINGIDKDLDISFPLKYALSQLDRIPHTEYCNFEIDQKNVLILKVYKMDQPAKIAISSNITDTIDKYLEDVLYSCIQLQSLAIYSEAKEDDRNDFMTKMLESKGYHVKDQTRRGKSDSGKSAGEIDLFIANEKGFPFSIIEAMNLNSLNKTYLATHIDKIYKYDTVGNQVNICLSYVKVSDFGVFWKNYCDYVKNREYNNVLLFFDDTVDKDFPYSEIRFAKAIHNRSSKLTYLYHIAVAMIQ